MSASKETSFLDSLRIQGRVIWALLMREIITRYGRDNLGFLWMVLAPMLFIGMIVGVRTSRADEINGLSFFAFFITGYCAAFMMRKTVGRCMNAVEPNRALMYHRNVKMIDIYAARLLLELAGESMASFFLLLLCLVWGLIPAPVDILQMLLAWGMLAWFACALALTLGSLSEMYDMVDKIWQPTSILLLLLSGAFFMIDWLPEATQEILLLLPWIHGMELLREGYFGSAVIAHYDLEYMTLWCLGLTLSGLVLMRSAAHKIA